METVQNDPDLQEILSTSFDSSAPAVESSVDVSTDPDMQNILNGDLYGGSSSEYVPDYKTRGMNPVREIFNEGAVTGVKRLLDPRIRGMMTRAKYLSGALSYLTESLPAMALTAGAEALSGKPVRANPLKALSGEESYEFGDVSQPLGAPKIVRQITGLGMAAASDPVAFLTRGLAVAAGKKAANAYGRHLALDLANNEEMGMAIIADKGKALSRKYASRDKYINSVDDLVKTVEPVYLKASDEMDKALKIAGDTPVSDYLIGKAGILLEEYLKTSSNPAAIENAMKQLTKSVKSSGSAGIAVRDIVNTYRRLGSTAARDVNTHLLERDLRNAVSKEVPELAQANALWSNWRKVDNAIYRMGIDVESVGEEGVKALRRKDPSGLAPLGQFDDARRNWQFGLDDLSNALTKGGYDPKDALAKATEITRAAIHRKVSGLPVPDLNLAPAAGFLFGGQAGSAQIAAGVAGSRVARHLFGRNKIRDAYKALNAGSVPQHNMLKVYKDAFKKVIQNGELTPAGKALAASGAAAQTLLRGSGMIASEGVSQALTGRSELLGQ